MRTAIATAALLVLFFLPAGATIHVVVNAGNTFSPSSLTINLGDTVNFSINSLHTVIEVSEATWNANGSTPLPGGFSRPAGGGMVVITSTGVHYYVCDNHNFSGMKGTITVDPPTGVGDEPAPRTFSLAPNYPNPFNPSTELRFTLARTADTEISVHDGIGRRIATLVSATLPAGEHAVSWDGSDAKGLPVGSGPYFVRMRAKSDAGEFQAARKVLLVR